jgi:hypothetical protein
MNFGFHECRGAAWLLKQLSDSALICCCKFVFLKQNWSLNAALWSLQVNLGRNENIWCRVVGRCFSCSYWKHSCIHKLALCTRRYFPRLLQSISQDTVLRCNFPIRHNSVHASHNSESFSFVYCCEVFHSRSGFICGVGFTCARGCVRACVRACVLYKVECDSILFLAARHILWHLRTGAGRVA